MSFGSFGAIGTFFNDMANKVKDGFNKVIDNRNKENESTNSVISEKVNSVLASRIAEESLKITEKYEGGGRYWAVNKNDAGSGVSLGKSQVNADRARQMLLSMRGKSAEEKKFFDDIMGDDMAKKMQNKWTNRKGKQCCYFLVMMTLKISKHLMQDKKMQGHSRWENC